MSLRRTDVDPECEPTFTIPAEVVKNGRRRTIPIYGDMLPAMQRQKRERDERYAELEWISHDGSGKAA